MSINKTGRVIAGIMLVAVLSGLPFFCEIFYIGLYYIGAAILIPIIIFRIIKDEEFERRFYERWQKARYKGFWTNVVYEGAKSFLIITGTVFTAQLFGNGLTPVQIISRLSNSVLGFLLVFILLLCLIIGIVAQYENEKRYSRIYYSMKDSSNS